MPRVSSRPPYTVLARFYDHMVGEAVAMNRHARKKVLGPILTRARTVCDLGCGTGSTAIELARSGKKVYAVDLAPAMCRMARRKSRRAHLSRAHSAREQDLAGLPAVAGRAKAGPAFSEQSVDPALFAGRPAIQSSRAKPNLGKGPGKPSRGVPETKLDVRVLCADMRRLRLPEPVDLVLCEFNPLNHLPRKSDLGRVARAVFRSLRPDGYFCFDLNTRRSLQEQYPSTQWIQTRDYCVVIHGGFDPRRDKAWLEFEWFIPSDVLHREGFIPSDSEAFMPGTGSARRKSRRRPNAWRRYRERLVDTCWSDAEIRSALRNAGFTRIRHWDGVAVRPPSPHQRRGFDSYYLAHKPAKR